MRPVLRTLLTTVAATAIAASAACASSDPLKLGTAAPMADAELVNVDGSKVSIASVAGKKGTLVVFTCNSCPWVKAWEERMVKMGNEYAARGIGVLFVNSNDPGRAPGDSFEAMVERAKERGMKFPYAMDETSELAKAFGATRTPEVFLFDAKGKLVYHGTVDDNAHKPAEVTKTYLADALGAVVAGKKIATTQTKALGCAIKFRGEEKAAAAKS